MNLKEQRNVFEEVGFHILEAKEAYRPIKFMMLVHLYGLHILWNGNFLTFL